MIPPSSAFTHAAHKLTPAARAAIEALQAMPLPPPAYTANPPPVLNLDPESDSSSATSSTPSLSDWAAPPVTIHINASIHIEGTLNQVALPPHPSSRPLRVIGENLRAASGSLLDYLGSSSTTANRLACDRAEQISDAVLQALNDSGVLAGTVTPMRALEVNVDASVTVKGERNILTTNVPLKNRAGAPALGSGTGPGTGTGSGSTPDTPSPLRVERGLVVQGGGLGPSASILLPDQAGRRTVEADANGIVEQGPGDGSMEVDTQAEGAIRAGDPMAMNVDVDMDVDVNVNIQTQTPDGKSATAGSFKAPNPIPAIFSPTQTPVPTTDGFAIDITGPNGGQGQAPYSGSESEIPAPRTKRKRTGTDATIATSSSNGGDGDRSGEDEVARQKTRGRRAGT